MLWILRMVLQWIVKNSNDVITEIYRETMELFLSMICKMYKSVYL